MLGVRVGHEGAGGHVAAGEHLRVAKYIHSYEQVGYVLLADLQGGVSDDLEWRHIVGVWGDWGRGMVAQHGDVHPGVPHHLGVVLQHVLQ